MSQSEVRCGCSRRPLLAMAGVDSNGEAFIHVKAYRGPKLLTNVVVTGGTAHILCRACNRWHRIKIRRGVEREIAPLPEQISLQ